VQVRQIAGLGGGDPGVQLLAVPAGEDLGELGDVPGEGVQVRAAFGDLPELEFLVVAERAGSRSIQLVTSRTFGGAGAAGGAAAKARNGCR
jgi:hypothetical protein